MRTHVSAEMNALLVAHEILVSLEGRCHRARVRVYAGKEEYIMENGKIMKYMEEEFNNG